MTATDAQPEAPNAPAAVIAALDDDLDTARVELETLVRIPSISADPAHAGDVRDCADTVAALMAASGLHDIRLLEVDGGHPYVVGEWNGAGADAPTVLLYAHHDVQPAGYADRWSSDPFSPREANGRLFGRGTADDKAGAIAHLAAVRAWLRTEGSLPCNVKVLVEGEEEIGSPTLGPFLAAHRDALAADVLLLADAGNWSVGTPGLTYSLRGLAGVDVSLRALDSPLHSGMAGGAVPDPVQALAKLLATLTDDHGDPAFDGVLDDYQAPGPAERERLAALPTNVDGLRAAWGLRPGVELTGDPAVSLFEHLWLRPVVTVIGIDGHPIAGSSNQIVAGADARISVRVGRGQDPARLNAALRAHLEQRVPWGLEITVTELD
ncbi:MAG: M20/M25/M40 family metallo-hydrolase, partial [Acidimicrobiia bacterium]